MMLTWSYALYSVILLHVYPGCVLLLCGLPVSIPVRLDNAGQLATSVEHYIVSLRKDSSLSNCSDVIRQVSRIPGNYISGGPLGGDVTSSLCEIFANKRTAKILRRMANVEYLEESQRFRSAASGCSCVTSTVYSFGIDRIGQRSLPIDLKGQFQTGPIAVYLLDTGVRDSHEDFTTKRVIWAKNLYDATTADVDGQGTHNAGIIAGTLVGIAKEAKIYSIKIQGKANNATAHRIINGLAWATSHRAANSIPKAVVQISANIPHETSVNKAVADAVTSGLVVVTSAGDSGNDACNTSPASETTAITVAYSDKGDAFHANSNHGKCVDIIAPGVENVGTCISGNRNDHFCTRTGSTGAAALVTGVLANYLACNTGSPAQVKTWLLKQATVDKVQKIPCDTNNRLLYATCPGQEVSQPSPRETIKCPTSSGLSADEYLESF